VDVSDQLHSPAALIPLKFPGTHWVEEYMDTSSGLDEMSKTRNTVSTLPRNLNSVVQPVA
jgi:hypothetical protein